MKIENAKQAKQYLEKIVRQILTTDPAFRCTWQVRRAKIVVPPSNGVCSVALTGDFDTNGNANTITLPYSSNVINAKVGDAVFVGCLGGNMSNAIVWQYATFGVIEKSVSGNPISIYDALPGNAGQFTITAPLTQLGTGTPSTSNIRKIVADNSLNVIVNSTTIPITLQTAQNQMAAGTIDVLTGTATITHECYTFTGTETLTGVPSSSSANYAYYVIGTYGSVVNDTTGANGGLCSHLPTASVNTSYTGVGCRIYNSSSSPSNARAFLKFTTGYSSLSAIKNILTTQYQNGTPVQVSYKLTTPKTISFAPIVIPLVSGSNTVSSSFGDSISMTYFALQN